MAPLKVQAPLPIKQYYIELHSWIHQLATGNSTLFVNYSAMDDPCNKKFIFLYFQCHALKEKRTKQSVKQNALSTMH